VNKDDSNHNGSECEITNAKKRNKRRDRIKRNNGEENYNEENKGDMILNVDNM